MKGLFLAFICAATIFSADANEKAPVVTVTLTSAEDASPGANALGFSERPRLSDVYSAFELPSDTYWPSTRLISQNKQTLVEEQREALVTKLIELAKYWRSEGDDEFATTAEATAKQIEGWSIVGAEFLGHVSVVDRSDTQVGEQTTKPALYSHWENARLDISYNPLLPLGNYEFYTGVKATPRWHLVGATTHKSVAFTTDVSVRELVKEHRAAKSAMNSDFVYMVDLSGNSREVPVAYYNAKNDPMPVGGIVVVGFNERHLPSRFENINHELTALARFWKPES